MKKILYFLFISVLALYLIGCAAEKTEQTEIKPITNSQETPNEELSSPVSQPAQESVTETEQETLKNTEMEPIKSGNLYLRLSEDEKILSGYQDTEMIYLKTYLYTYLRSTGSFPESMSDIINGGFSLFWLRNVWDGSPVKIVSSRALKDDMLDMGKVSWKKVDNYQGQIGHVSLKSGSDQQNGTESWKAVFDELEYLSASNSQGQGSLDLMRKIDRKGDGGRDAVTVKGGIKPIDDVSDPEKRLIYGMCGTLLNHLIASSSRFYWNNNIPPLTVSDMFIVSPYAEMSVVIAENYDRLAQLLKKTNAEFKIGFDYEQNVQYCILTIDGEELISYCSRFDAEARKLDADSDKGVHTGCGMSYIDMSNPLISTDNMSSEQIPDGVKISIADIVYE